MLCSLFDLEMDAKELARRMRKRLREGDCPTIRSSQASGSRMSELFTPGNERFEAILHGYLYNAALLGPLDSVPSSTISVTNDRDPPVSRAAPHMPVGPEILPSAATGASSSNTSFLLPALVRSAVLRRRFMESMASVLEDANVTLTQRRWLSVVEDVVRVTKDANTEEEKDLDGKPMSLLEADALLCHLEMSTAVAGSGKSQRQATEFTPSTFHALLKQLVEKESTSGVHRQVRPSVHCRDGPNVTAGLVGRIVGTCPLDTSPISNVVQDSTDFDPSSMSAAERKKLAKVLAVIGEDPGHSSGAFRSFSGVLNWTHLQFTLQPCQLEVYGPVVEGEHDAGGADWLPLCRPLLTCTPLGSSFVHWYWYGKFGAAASK